MAPEVQEVREDPEDREDQEVQEDREVLPQKGRDHREVQVAREGRLQNHHPVNQVVQEDPGDQEVPGDREDPADLEGLEVQLQKDQNQEKPHPRRSQRKSLGRQEVRGDLEGQGDRVVQEDQEAQEDRVVREDQVDPRQQNDLQGNQPNPPKLPDHREGQEVPEDPGDLVGREDPVAPVDPADQIQNLPVLLQSRPSMHLEIPAGQEARGDREGQADREDPADQEDQLRPLLKHLRHRNQVSKKNK